MARQRYIGLTKQVLSNGGFSSIDYLYGPYSSITEGLKAVPSEYRALGRTLGIITDGVVKEYWFESGIKDSDLIPKFLDTHDIHTHTNKEELDKIDQDLSKSADVIHNSFKTKDFVAGERGKGASIDNDGNAELQSIIVHQFVEFAELRWNKTSIYLGTEIRSYGGGIIESVTPDKDSDGNEILTGTIKLHLNAGEIGKIAVDDICWGVFHDGMNEVNDSADYDDLKGVIKYAGYFTTFFRITSIIETTYNSIFTYALRQVSDSWTKPLHPRAMMHFAQRGNFTNTSRQDFKISTLMYEKIYEKVATWELSDDNVTYFNGYKEYFSKSGITLGNGRTMYISNVVIDGTIQQFENLGVTMSFDTGGDNFLAYGESKTVKSIIKDGYGRNVTANFDTWAVTRESGDTQADLVWNAKAVINGGVFTVQWTDTKNDLGSGLSTLFNVTATKGTTKTTSSIEF